MKQNDSNHILFVKPAALSLFLLFSLFFPLSLPAQTAAELDALLETQTVTAAQAARFVLGAAGILEPHLSGDLAQAEAFRTAQSFGWLRVSADSAVNLRETAFLVMQAFNLKGGIVYSVYPSPRYAYREMVYLNLIQGSSDPSMKVSGERLLHIIGRTLSFAGEDE